MSLLEQAWKKYVLPDFDPTDDELAEVLGSDWEDIRVDRKQLEAARYCARTARQVAAGITPESYTSTTECKHCGSVPIWESCPPEVPGCPWCFNRIKGLQIPKVNNNE